MWKASLITALFVVASAVGTVPPATADYELEGCLETCRDTYDPVKSMGDYQACVDDCRRRHENNSAVGTEDR